MKLYRIWAIILRFLYHARHSLDKLVDIFYWPLLDLILLGLTSIYFFSLSEDSTIVSVIVGGVLLWVVVYRAQAEISNNLLTDLWDRNLINLFVSPLRFSEWMASFIILGIIKGAISFAFAAAIGYWLYHVNILIFGMYLPVFYLILAMTGWAIGLGITALIMRFGTRIQALSWTVVWLISPFAALYFPLSTLPSWGQAIAKFIPASYAFESARQLYYGQAISSQDLSIALLLSLFYVILALYFVRTAFNSILNRGMSKLY